ncbi:MAG: bifunctional [glutamate--ammonia ligase]-adenylyl-L-tyrosine phosphorylase/[glutamate--ammonia-ligase] adenylyltransferase [Candidatus Schekmanbacteria bacterium]|nr:MAG: bifunctional [glutamate--ammonia ligase]-adenylyl-L-tyrosine phosphorylase/[glutamate--ammonia-ligase] adenylyltransferase [Candidatus Schekmanbacteria bacterium]
MSALTTNVLFQTLKNNRYLTNSLLRFFSASRLAVDIIIRNPEKTLLILKDESFKELKSKETYLKEIEEEVNYKWEQTKFRNFLLKFKELETLKIMFSDYFEYFSFEETTLSLSNLAKAIIETAYRYAVYHAEKRFGIPLISISDEKEKVKCRFSVVALGKLGGNELNYFSDIDLLFIYTSDKGKVYKDPNDLSSEVNISIHEYYTKIAEIITALLRGDGGKNSIYRVDLRLRPEGRSGDLVNSLRSLEIYYESWGQTWERQALIKASHAGGDSELTNEFLKMIEPFIYRKYLDISSINEIKSMKEKIDRSLKADGTSFLNVKNGYGGIREIEFFIQALQLIYGGKDKNIRHENSLTALKKLYELRYINFEDYNILTRSYKFLRTVEHRLQMMDGLQTHLLPENREEKLKFAKRIGYTEEGFYDELEIFESDYEFFTKSVREAFNHLFETKEEISDKDDILIIWEGTLPKEKSLIALREMGFTEPEKALTNISRLREGKPFAHYSSKYKIKMNETAPVIFKEILSTADPDRALNNLEKFVSSTSMKESVFPFLTDISPTREILLNIFSNSQFISEMLIQRPQLIDFINYAREEVIKSFDEDDEIREKNKEEIFKEIIEEIFNVGVDDILKKSNPLKVSRHLSSIADNFLKMVLHRAEIKCMEELGIDGRDKAKRGNLAIYGLGKLGGEEITYSSDLDIIFVYEGKGTIKTKKGEISLQEYYTKVARQVFEIAEEAEKEGIKFIIDSRLRPSGRSGLLVQDSEAYKHYFTNQAKVWERQAYTKLRFICGLKGPVKEFEEIMEDMIFGKSLSNEEALEIDEMRQRMEKEMARDKKQFFHVKFGEGGIVDIEFIVQALILKFGKENVGVRQNNTAKGLKELFLANIINKEDYQRLIKALLFLRTIENRIRILENRPLNTFYKKPERIVRLAMRIGYKQKDNKSPAEQLIEDYEKETQTVRMIYEKIFSNLVKNDMQKN